MPLIVKWGRWLVTFAFLNLTWVIFRADSIRQAGKFVRQLFGLKKPDITMKTVELLGDHKFYVIRFLAEEFSRIDEYLPIVILGVISALCIVCVVTNNTQERMVSFKPTAFKSFITAVLLTWCIISFSGVSTFLYWNF